MAPAAQAEDSSYELLDDYYLTHFPSTSPRPPALESSTSVLPPQDNSQSPHSQPSSSNQQLDDDLDIVLSLDSEPTRLLHRRTRSAFAAYRDSPILRRPALRRPASRSLSALQIKPPKKTYIWDPLTNEWGTLNAQKTNELPVATPNNLKSLPPVTPSEPLPAIAPDEPLPVGTSNEPSEVTNTKKLERHVSEPPTPRFIMEHPTLRPLSQDKKADFDNNYPTLEFAVRYSEPSPLQSEFDSSVASDDEIEAVINRQITVQILGAFNLTGTSIEQGRSRICASIAIGERTVCTPLSNIGTSNPVWNSKPYFFDSVATCDTVVIDVWNCVDSRVKAKLQGSFTCTVKRLLILQAITEDALHLTLDRFKDETDLLNSTQCGTISIRVHDSPSLLSVDKPLPFTPVSNTFSMSPSPSHSSFFASSPPPWPSDENWNSISKRRSHSPLPSTPTTATTEESSSHPHPKWFTDIIGRTLSMTKRYKWIPSGNVIITEGPVCGGRYCDIYVGELRKPEGNTRVALKQLRVFANASDNMRKMFVREVQFWSRLRHRHVLPFWGCWELDQYRLFMISPWALNGNSMQYVKAHPEVDRRRILLQTAEALTYLHSVVDPAVVHGDLKADNVLIGPDGDALLADFGLARYVEKLSLVSGTPSCLSTHGHLRFSAPELLYQPSGEDPRPTPESDVFAFACLMVQLFTEELPFAEIKPDPQVITDIVQGRTPRRPRGIAERRGLDDPVWRLAMNCWQYEPDLRPPMSRIAASLRLITGRSRTVF